jgi:hypothetical protein
LGQGEITPQEEVIASRGTGALKFQVEAVNASTMLNSTISNLNGFGPQFYFSSLGTDCRLEVAQIKAWVDRTRRAPSPFVFTSENGARTSDSALDWSTTIAIYDGTARKVLLWVAWRSESNTDTLTGITINGNALTQVGPTLTYFSGTQDKPTVYNKLALFYLDDSGMGAYNVGTSLVFAVGANTTLTIAFCAIQLHGAAQGAVGASATQTSATASNSVNITPSADSSLVLSCIADDAPTTGASSGMTATGVAHSGKLEDTTLMERATTEYLEMAYGWRPYETDDEATVAWTLLTGAGNSGQIACTIAPYWSE